MRELRTDRVYRPTPVPAIDGGMPHERHRLRSDLRRANEPSILSLCRPATPWLTRSAAGPLVYMTLGTNTNSGLRMFRPFIDAVRDEAIDALITTGSAGAVTGLGPPPGNVPCRGVRARKQPCCRSVRRQSVVQGPEQRSLRSATACRCCSWLTSARRTRGVRRPRLEQAAAASLAFAKGLARMALARLAAATNTPAADSGASASSRSRARDIQQP
jgi:hypothetical protein